MKFGKNVLIGVVLAIAVLSVSVFYFSGKQIPATGSAVDASLQSTPSATSTSSATQTTSTTRTIMATISHSQGYYFEGESATDPTTITVNKGDTVKIITNDLNPSHNHGITIDAYGINQVTSGNPTITFVADKAGTFPIYCKTCLDGPLGAHPWMTGTLIVNG